MKPNAEFILSAGREIARRAAPYFRPLLLKLVMREMPGLNTVATTAQAVFLWDRAFVETVTPKEMAGLFLHEVMHLWLKHHARVGNRDAREWNCAGDRAINPGILELGLALPKGGLMPADIAKANGLTADEYYQTTPPPPDGGGAARGKCGGCSGNPVDGEPDTSGDAEGRTPVEMERTGRQVSEAIRDAAKTAGRVPASWSRYAEEQLRPATVPWQERLAYATRRAVAFRAGGVVHRYDAPSRRQAGLGFGPGRPILARMRQPVPIVAVAIDTSGSMGKDDLTACLAEVQGVLRAVGAEVQVIICDATIHADRKVRSAAQAGALLAGGGGTDFRPVFDRLARATPRPDVLVFLTDGYGAAPSSPPQGTAVIWALVGGSVTTPATWGESVRIPPASAA